MRCAVRPPDKLLEAVSWPELAAILIEKRVDIVVIDPGAAGWDGLAAAIDLLVKFPSVPVLGYTIVNASTAHAVVELNRNRQCRVLLHPHEGLPSEFREALLHAHEGTLAARFLVAIDQQLLELPECLRNAVCEMFDHPQSFEAASDIALVAHVRSEKVNRRFALAGLGTPKKMLIAARLLRAYSYITASGKSIESIAVAIGYHDPHVLRAHIRRVLRSEPRTLASLSEHELTERLFAWVTSLDRVDLAAFEARTEKITMTQNRMQMTQSPP